MRAMTQELAVVCPHRHRVRTAGRAHRALLLRPDLRSTLRNRVPVAGMRRRPRFSRAHDGQPGSPHRGTRQRNAGLWDNRPGSARAEEPLAYPEFSRLLHPLRVPPGDPLFGGSGPPSGGSRSPPWGPDLGAPGGLSGVARRGYRQDSRAPKKGQKLPFFGPLRRKVQGEWGGSAHSPDPTAQSAPPPARRSTRPARPRRRGRGGGGARGGGCGGGLLGGVGDCVSCGGFDRVLAGRAQEWDVPQGPSAHLRARLG